MYALFINRYCWTKWKVEKTKSEVISSEVLVIVTTIVNLTKYNEIVFWNTNNVIGLRDIRR